MSRSKELQNLVLKQCMLKEKAQTVLDGRDNFCPESQTGEEVLLVGLRQRFPELEPGPHQAWEQESGLVI